MDYHNFFFSQHVLLSSWKNKIWGENKEFLLHLKNIAVNATDPQMASHNLGFSLAV